MQYYSNSFKAIQLFVMSCWTVVKKDVYTYDVLHASVFCLLNKQTLQQQNEQ